MLVKKSANLGLQNTPDKPPEAPKRRQGDPKKSQEQPVAPLPPRMSHFSDLEILILHHYGVIW